MFNIFKRIPSISTKTLESIVGEIQLIDVRTANEYKNGHILGAKNVPLHTIDKFESNQKVYVICQSGMRSKRAAKHLISKDLDVVNVKGGMNAWTGKTVIGKR